MTNTEFFVKAFLAFFVIIGPIDLMVVFTALTRRKKTEEQFSIAIRSNIIAFIILLFFTVFGSALLSSVGISIAALKASGGFLLMVVGYKMIFDTDGHGTDYGDEEAEEAKSADDITVFPLATPLLAGAGAMSAAILFSAEAGDNIMQQVLVVLSFSLVLLMSAVLFVMASRMQQMLGATFVNIITRVMGILLVALALQFVLDGLHSAGVF